MGKHFLNIRADEFVVFANKLEKIGRADMPVAVRSTLNNMAFEMKKKQIDKEATREFDYRRNKTLYRAVTGATKAQGLDIAKMESKAGVIKRSGLTQVAQGLADQQEGGKTAQKATPLRGSRISKNEGKKVRKASQLRNLKNAVKAKSAKGQKFIKRAAIAHKYDKPLLLKSTLVKITRIKKKERGIDIQMQALYRINPSGTVKLKKKRPFVNNAADVVAKQMPKEFIKQAKRRLNK